MRRPTPTGSVSRTARSSSTLATKKMERKKAALLKQGWGWVETDLDGSSYELTGKYGRMFGELTPEQKALTGCLVLLDHRGKFDVVEKLVRKGDAAAMKALSPESMPSGGAPRGIA